MFGVSGIILLSLVLWFARPATIVDSKPDRVRIQLQMVSQALKDYAEKDRRFPNAEEGLKALLTRGYFNESALVDAWNNPLRYSCIDVECQRALVWSLGPGGIDNSGGGDDIALRIETNVAEARARRP
jgi:hypothetical protein